jgi:hypothetical protein
VWSAVFLTSLVFGRAFCGYICPFHGLQPAWEKVADKPRRLVRHLPLVKYVGKVGSDELQGRSVVTDPTGREQSVTADV